MWCTCPECGAKYSGAQTRGGHCRGGAYGGCCQTFANEETGSAHKKVGEPCLTTDQMLEKGWRSTDHGWSKSKPMPAEAWAQRKGLKSTARATVEAIPGSPGTEGPENPTAPQMPSPEGPPRKRHHWWKW